MDMFVCVYMSIFFLIFFMLIFYDMRNLFLSISVWCLKVSEKKTEN